MQTSTLSLEKKMELYSRAISLQRQGIGYVKASKILNLPKGTLANWMCRGKNPFSQINMANLNPSPYLSYIIGVMKGDGSYFKTRNQTYRISLAVKDIEFIRYYLKCLEKVLKRKYSLWKERERFYKTQATSKHLYEFLKSDKVWNIAAQFPSEFIKGFFDSEGWIDTSSKRVCCANANQKIIKFVKKLLLSLNIKSTKIYQKKKRGKNFQRIYELRIIGKGNLKNFEKTVGFTIARKRNKLSGVLSYAK